MNKRTRSQRGSAIVVVLAVSMAIAGLAYSFLLSVTVEQETQRSRTESIHAIYIAEAGEATAAVNVAPLLDIGASSTIGSADAPIPFGGGEYWINIKAEEDGTYTLLSHARYGETTVAIETRWGREYHALRDYAMYSGNRSGDVTSTVTFGGSLSDRDIVQGKVFVSGDVVIENAAELHGDVTATGTITGDPVDSGARSGAPKIETPDLKQMDYATISDYQIDSASPFDWKGRIAESDPRHIFVKDFRTDLGPAGFVLDNTNYFLGDPHEGGSIAKVSVSADGNNKIYFVDGNLWIEPQGKISRLIKSPIDGTKITIVAKGNIYFADGFEYDNNDDDAVLFIALTDGESFHDLDGDNQYDPGEPILHDDGDGVYEGPTEGSGNIYFGDPNGGPVGNVHGFMYADNFFEDHVLESNGDPLPFEVTGFMSAGEQVQIQRDFGGDHASMKLTFDDRVATGDMILPGFPEASSLGEMTRLSWRIVTP